MARTSLLSPKMKEVLKYLQTVESAGLEDIYKNVSFSYYHNYKKYLGEILSRMVKAKVVIRIKNGLFKYNSMQPMPRQEPIAENQTNLFN